MQQTVTAVPWIQMMMEIPIQRTRGIVMIQISPYIREHRCYVMDWLDNNCDGYKDFLTDEDKDGDGVTWCRHWQTGLSDCNDNNPNRFPGNLEGPFGDATCSDGIDNDCDNKVDGSDPGCDSNCNDDDGDGYGLFGNVSCPNAGADCNDNNAAINPGGDDANCNGIDEDCVGGADSGYVEQANVHQAVNWSVRVEQRWTPVWLVRR
jgi:hypothetical protein